MAGPLINAADLALNLGEREHIVVADCRFELANPQAGADAHRAGHIPGAFFLDLNRDLSGPIGSTGGRHPLPAADAFSATMRGIGITADTYLVAYDEGSHAGAARLWWLARYFGHRNVSVLNGGLAAWVGCGYAIDDTAPAGANGTFAANVDESLQVDFDILQGVPARPLLIDCRDPSRYAGIAEPIDPRAGHIPGALNMPWQDSLDPEGGLRSVPELRARWCELLTQDSRPVLYCGSGVTACVNLLALDFAGFKGARLYAGGWSDWCQRDGDVATGDTP